LNIPGLFILFAGLSRLKYGLTDGHGQSATLDDSIDSVDAILRFSASSSRVNARVSVGLVPGIRARMRVDVHIGVG
jgi:hypothetical protein